ncbi:hypothetical protein ABZZ74_23515 [Streptomyces sp. NPDC006476]|uniref:hypothetical protein n=1 Tax=Streptomyces sp. NPDC006476 TaxID=3157175 RepID=UPI0033A70D8D
MTRAWLPHPARTLGRPIRCPTGLPRFATLDFACEALRHGYADHQLTAWQCGKCGGAHVTDQSEASPAGDCEPDWAPQPAITDIPTQEHL